MAGAYLITIQRLYKIISYKVEAELISKNDQLITEVRLNDAKLKLLSTENNLVLAKMELNRLIGYEITKPVDVEEEIPLTVYDINDEELGVRALKQRPEVLLQGERIEAGKYNADLTASQYLPQWGLGVNALWGVPSPDLTSTPDFNYSVFSTFSVPLFLWGKSDLDVQSQQLLADVESEQYQQAKDLVTLDVENSRYSYIEAIKRVELTSASLLRAEENLDIMTTRYIEGLTPILQVLDAQVFWLKAYEDFIEAKRIYHVSYSALMRSVGELQITEE